MKFATKSLPQADGDIAPLGKIFSSLSLCYSIAKPAGRGGPDRQRLFSIPASRPPAVKWVRASARNCRQAGGAKSDDVGQALCLSTPANPANQMVSIHSGYKGEQGVFFLCGLRVRTRTVSLPLPVSTLLD